MRCGEIQIGGKRSINGKDPLYRFLEEAGTRLVLACRACLAGLASQAWLVSCPPAPRCGDSDQGGCVGEWMVPRCYGIEGFEKGLLITKKLVSVYVFF